MPSVGGEGVKQILQAKAGQYTRLQLLCLAISIVAYLLQSITVAVVMLVVGTVFGLLATYTRLQEAKRINQQSDRNRRPR
jgi:hypothetical protein